MDVKIGILILMINIIFGIDLWKIFFFMVLNRSIIFEKEDDNYFISYCIVKKCWEIDIYNVWGVLMILEESVDFLDGFDILDS